MKKFSVGWATWAVIVFLACGSQQGPVRTSALRVECVRDDAGVVTRVDGFWGSGGGGTATDCTGDVSDGGLTCSALVSYGPSNPNLPVFREFSTACSLASVPPGTWSTGFGTPATITIEADGGVRCP